MTFTRPANHRQLTFEEIAKSAKISVNEVWFFSSGCHCSTAAPWGRGLPRLKTTERNSMWLPAGPMGAQRHRGLTPALRAQVELLVMKALSVGLVKGSIDEVDGRVHMTWVQPRVLDLQQVRPSGHSGRVCPVLASFGQKPLRKKALSDEGFLESELPP